MGDLDIVIFLDRELDISIDLSVPRGTTVAEVKSQLAAADPTGSTQADAITLRLPAKSGRSAKSLPDNAQISVEHSELDVVTAGAESELDDSADADEASKNALPGDSSTTSGGVSGEDEELTEDEPPYPAMAPADVTELDEDQLDRQAELNEQAAEYLESGEREQALDSLTQAITMGCASAMMYSKRAQILLQLGRPGAAIHDCTAALEINPNSAKAFKIRGRAHTKREGWIEAQSDFREALKIDYDEDIEDECKQVAAKLKEAEKAAEEAKLREEEAELGPQMWEIVGGADTNGISVREDVGVLSRQKDERLACGTIVSELALMGKDLFFEKVSGDGPEEGWVTIIEYGKPVACRVYPDGEPPFPKLSPPHIRSLSDEEQDNQNSCKQKAQDALDDGDLDVALKMLSEAVAVGCANALLYGKRAQILLQLERPRAAINDCTAALSMNSESAKAYKTRARAYAKLEQWADAHQDFQQGLKYECDDEACFEESEQVAATLKKMQSAAMVESSQLWEIVGGAESGGILVREGIDLGSQPKSTRLGVGAIVGEIKLEGERLNYRKLTGSGPQEGWISIALRDKVLAMRTTKSKVSLDVEAYEEEEKEEPPFPPLAPQLPPWGISQENKDRQIALKEEANDAYDDGDWELALDKLSEAVALGEPSALMYSKRAQTLMELDRPRAAINDSTAALTINPDSAKALGIRARARSRLKQWAAAHSDFQESLKIDYDDDLYNESLKTAAKMKDIQLVATESRLLAEAAAEEKKRQLAREAKIAADLAEREAREVEARRKRTLDAEKQANVYKILGDPVLSNVYQVAKRQGWMGDFMSKKRGACKCGKCEIYVWRPQRVSSCAARNVGTDCALCGCPPRDHQDLGFAEHSEGA
mmetsp:Transcript_48347/g.87399  ORF Transcript_48347/g.87399 Transcript_48347/m.87399 type:complete len:883 (-) Transcript_48347:236-2884(-)